MSTVVTIESADDSVISNSGGGMVGSKQRGAPHVAIIGSKKVVPSTHASINFMAIEVVISGLAKS
jgi:hypothetical protein